MAERMEGFNGIWDIILPTMEELLYGKSLLGFIKYFKNGDVLL